MSDLRRAAARNAYLQPTPNRSIFLHQKSVPPRMFLSTRPNESYILGPFDRDKWVEVGGPSIERKENLRMENLQS
jgi:hypothetical protein